MIISYHLFHVFVAATVGFQVQDAVVGGTLTEVSSKTVGHIDYEQRQVRRIGDRCGCDVHEVFQAPVLFGITKIELNGMITNDKFLMHPVGSAPAVVVASTATAAMCVGSRPPERVLTRCIGSFLGSTSLPRVS